MAAIVMAGMVMTATALTMVAFAVAAVTMTAAVSTSGFTASTGCICQKQRSRENRHGDEIETLHEKLLRKLFMGMLATSPNAGFIAPPRIRRPSAPDNVPLTNKKTQSDGITRQEFTKKPTARCAGELQIAWGHAEAFRCPVLSVGETAMVET
jgi:hypothetical protein